MSNESHPPILKRVILIDKPIKQANVAAIGIPDIDYTDLKSIKDIYIHTDRALLLLYINHLLEKRS